MKELSEDENKATIKLKAMDGYGCKGCYAEHEIRTYFCRNLKCTKKSRKDGRSVIWVVDE